MRSLPPAPRGYLFLFDYDGTLTDFKNDPNRSLLPPASRRFLQKLRQKHPVVIITGRYLDRLYSLSHLVRFPAVGTHGFETRYLPGYLSFATPTQEKRYHQEANAIWKAVRSLQDQYPGIHIEKKPYSSTLHYRGTLLSTKNVQTLEMDFIRRCRRVITPSQWKFEKGKKMVEVIPKGFSKGNAVKKLLKVFPKHFPIYAGDDLADIPAMKAVQKRGLAIAIGHRIPRRDCQIRFQSPVEFIGWLKRQKL